jgi:hypothetical protein
VEGDLGGLDAKVGPAFAKATAGKPRLLGPGQAGQEEGDDSDSAHPSPQSRAGPGL